VDTKLKPGYYDKDELMLHVNFSLLVDFVEKECAWMELMLNHSNDFRVKLPKLIRQLFFQISDKDLGLAYISGMSVNEGMGAYTDVLKLYIWWTETRINRKTPEEESGIENFRNEMIKKYDSLGEFVQSDNNLLEYKSLLSPSEDKKYLRLIKLYSSIEDSYEKEDQSMLIKLMKIRSFLWT
jgi:hypothetical protein